ncbi:MAG: hypothetical protein AAGE52_10815 [Myxococcota bacterium]
MIIKLNMGYRSFFFLLLASSLICACGDDDGSSGPIDSGSDRVDAGTDAGATPGFDGSYGGTITIDCIDETRPVDFLVVDGELAGSWAASIAGGTITGTIDDSGMLQGTSTVVVRTPRGECDVVGTFSSDGTASGTFTCTEGLECAGTWSVTRGAGITPDMDAQMRLSAANDRIRAARCGCDMGRFESAAICEAFNSSDEADACSESAFTSHFDTVGTFFTCLADVDEALAACYEAASCDGGAVEACDATAESATMACPAVPSADSAPYLTTRDTCVEENVVGPAGVCPDDSGAVSTTGAAVFMGSTIGAGDDLASPDGCVTARGGGASPDRAFRWSAPAAGDYTFDTVGSSFDTVLYVLNDCDGAESLGCNDDTMMGELRSTVTATLTEGQEVLVVVEGFSFINAGNFVVNINEAP